MILHKKKTKIADFFLFFCSQCPTAPQQRSISTVYQLFEPLKRPQNNMRVFVLLFFFFLFLFTSLLSFHHITNKQRERLTQSPSYSVCFISLWHKVKKKEEKYLKPHSHSYKKKKIKMQYFGWRWWWWWCSSTLVYGGAGEEK